MSRFCTYCGRPLNEGEICSCQQKKENTHQEEYLSETNQMNAKAERLVSATKNMIHEICSILKAPVTHGKELINSGNSVVGIKFIILKAIVAVIILLIAIMKFKSMLGNYVGYYADYIEIPYFRMIFIVIIFTAGLDFLEGILMNLLTLVFQGTGGIQRMLSLIGVRALYQAVGMSAVGLLALFSIPAAAVSLALISVFALYLEHHLFIISIRCNENKKLYAFLLEKTCFCLTCLLLNMMFLSGIIEQIRRFFH